MVQNLNGVNFWTNGKEGAIIDKDDVILAYFDKVFVKRQFSSKVTEAMDKYGFDLEKEFMLTNDTLRDAILRLNVSRLASKLPLTIPQEEVETHIRIKLKEILN